MNFPTVTVGLVLHGSKYLKESLPTLVNQDYPNLKFVFLDQGEADGYSASKLIREELPQIARKVTLLQGPNLMHSGGHNRIIRDFFEGDWYFCVSNDMLYPENLISKMVQALAKNPEFGAAGCELLFWDYEKGLKSNLIDSFGLAVKPWLQVIDLGQTEPNEGQYNDRRNIFGPTGAMAVYARKTIEKISINGHFFDPQLHNKNDIDVAWRLQWAGVKTLLVHDVKVWHHRFARKKVKLPIWNIASSFKGDQVIYWKNLNQPLPIYNKVLAWGYRWLKICYWFAKYQQIREDIKEWPQWRKRLLNSTSVSKIPNNLLNFLK